VVLPILRRECGVLAGCIKWRGAPFRKNLRSGYTTVALEVFHSFDFFFFRGKAIVSEFKKAMR
jgi:hypothetical protein